MTKCLDRKSKWTEDSEATKQRETHRTRATRWMTTEWWRSAIGHLSRLQSSKQRPRLFWNFALLLCHLWLNHHLKISNFKFWNPFCNRFPSEIFFELCAFVEVIDRKECAKYENWKLRITRYIWFQSFSSNQYWHQWYRIIYFANVFQWSLKLVSDKQAWISNGAILG